MINQVFIRLELPEMQNSTKTILDTVSILALQLRKYDSIVLQDNNSRRPLQEFKINVLPSIFTDDLDHSKTNITLQKVNGGYKHCVFVTTVDI